MDFTEALRLLRRGNESLPEDIGALSEDLEGVPAQQVVADAAAAIPHTVVTSSFGADAVVLLHIVSTAAADVPVLFLDTGFHFAETLDYRQQIAEDFGLRVVDVEPEPWVRRQADREGVALPAADPDTCCRLRKTLPLQSALRGVDAWITGIRRVTTLTRASTPIVQAQRREGRWLLRIAPLATWTDADVERYIAQHGLSRHPLVGQGYPSIGCAPCTAPAAVGEDPRNGRWADRPDKTECGLHLPEPEDDPTRTATTLRA